MSASTRQPHFAILLGLAWLLVMLQLVAQHLGETAQTLTDTDDAMRLAQLQRLARRAGLVRPAPVRASRRAMSRTGRG